MIHMAMDLETNDKDYEPIAFFNFFIQETSFYRRCIIALKCIFRSDIKDGFFGDFMLTPREATNMISFLTKYKDTYSQWKTKHLKKKLKSIKRG